MILAHDQNWSADDWWTIALLPPGMFVLVMLLLSIVGLTLHRETFWNDFRFSAAFIGTICGGAWLIMWALVGISRSSARFPRSCGRVLCVHSSGSVHSLFALSERGRVA